MTRKNHLIAVACFSAATLAALNSCSNDEMEGVSSSGNSVIVASFEGNAGTRTAVANDYSLVWSKNDQFNMYYTEAEQDATVYTLQGEGGAKNGTFTGTAPSGKTASFAIFAGVGTGEAVADNTLSLTLPASLTGYEGTSNGPMYAKVADPSDLNALSFKHMAALVKLAINKIPAGVSSLTLTADKPIAGAATADLTAEFPELTLTSAATGKTVTISFTATEEAETSKEFYVPVPAGTYNFTATLTSNTGTFTVTANNKTLRRADMLLVGPVDCQIINATKASDINTALETAVTDENKNASIVLSGDISTSNVESGLASTAIDVPQVNGSNVNLTFSSVPTTTDGSSTTPLKITSGAESSSTEAINKVTIAVPEITGEAKAPSLEITMPATTVTLEATESTATYGQVTAKTATNTLIVAAGVTVDELIIAGGNVEVYGTVKSIKRAEGSINTDETTTVSSFGAADIIAVTNTDDKIVFKSTWDGVSKTSAARTDIYTAAQLAYYAITTNPTTAKELAATILENLNLYTNIDFDKKPWPGMVLGASKVFDGKKHTVENIVVTEYALDETSIYTPAACVGFFAEAKSGSTVQNITVNGFEVEGTAAAAKWVGALVGMSRGASTYTNCHAENVKIISESADSYRLGGLIGFINSTAGYDVELTDCSASNVTIKGSFSIGGLVGTVQGTGLKRTFKNCDVDNVALSINEASSAIHGAWSGSTFYGPRAWAGYMSKFIGDIYCRTSGSTPGTVEIDGDCSVDKVFTAEELASFGYNDIADYSYASTATAEEIQNKKDAAKHYSLKDATSPFVPAVIDAGTVTINGVEMVSGTHHSLYTELR